MGRLLRWLIGIFSASKEVEGSGSAAGASTTSGSHGDDISITRTTFEPVQSNPSSEVEMPITVPVADPNQEEIRRRRDMVRALFNDFWKVRDDKPESFSDRLNEAEPYLNERLAASGERWQLDAGTRRLLSLPTGPSSRGRVNGQPI